MGDGLMDEAERVSTEVNREWVREQHERNIAFEAYLHGVKAGIEKGKVGDLEAFRSFVRLSFRDYWEGQRGDGR